MLQYYPMKILLPLFIVCCALNAQAQTMLTGTVTDETGERLIGATVKVSEGKSFLCGVITDFNGQYRISIDPGTYTIEFVYTGYLKSTVQDIHILDGQDQELNQQLKFSGESPNVIPCGWHFPNLIDFVPGNTGVIFTSNQLRRM